MPSFFFNILWLGLTVCHVASAYYSPSPSTRHALRRIEVGAHSGYGSDIGVANLFFKENRPVSKVMVKKTSQGQPVRIRELEFNDLDNLVTLAEDEFLGPVANVFDELNALILKRVVYEAFRLRLRYNRRHPQDHKVFVVDQDPFAAFIEISRQPAIGITAPALPWPYWAKMMMALFVPVKPYISNLLVDRSLRRQGYAQVLVQRCEDFARSIGEDCIYLHADADYSPAVSLYTKLGYQVICDDPDWVAKLKGIKLRYMKKELL